MKKVLAGGRFNIIHPGHVYFLEKAKALGDYLVVVVANDKTVRRSKQALIFPASERKKMVESLRCVDRVRIGYNIGAKDSYWRVIEKEKPNIIALGYDQKVKKNVLKKYCEDVGISCEVVRIGNYKGYHTKKIIKK